MESLSNGRLGDWDQRLVAAMMHHQQRPFAWGKTDCAAFYADCVAAVTGTDPLFAYRPWLGEGCGLRRLAGEGFERIVDWIATRHDEIVPVDARSGDVGYAHDIGRLSFPAVISGAHAFARSDAGWIVMPRTQLVRAFRVG